MMSVLPATLARQELRAVEVPDFEHLYRTHVDTIWRFLERLGVPTRLVEDATQDTFLVAHRQLPSFRGASSLKTWLHGIALRVARDYRRHESRKGDWAELDAQLADGRGAPDESTANREQLGRVLRLLDALDEAQRTVFVLVEFEGYTAPEVAQLTSTNVNTVSTRLRAARQRFNELVEAMGVDS